LHPCAILLGFALVQNGLRLASQTMGIFERRFDTAAILARVAVLGLVLFANSCGSSSQTSVTGPSPTKCAATVTNSSPAVPASGGSGSLTLDTARECSWSASADGPWITLTPTEGQGPATIAYSVAPNVQGTQRRGSVVVANQRVEIVQDAAPCRYDVSPSQQSVTSSGGEVDFNLSATPGCAWNAQSGATWISGATPSSGVGDATVKFNVAVNPADPRSATATIAGITISIGQAGVAAPPPPAPAPEPAPTPAPPTPTPPTPAPPTPAPTPAPAPTPPSPSPPTPPPPTPPSCTYSVSPTAKTTSASGDDVTIGVTAPANCDWTAKSSAGWVTVASGASGSGNGSVRLVVAKNNGAARSATVSVAGQQVTINQQAAPAPAPPPCNYDINPKYYNSGRGADDVRIQVSAPDGCTWTAKSDASWAKVSEGATGSGNGSVRVLIDSNSGAPRRATITIAGIAFALTQEGPQCNNRIDPTSRSIDQGDADITVNVTAAQGCTWTAASDVPWISVTDGRSGSGSGAVRLKADANKSGSPRTGTVQIAGQTFTLQQGGPSCSYSIKPTWYNAGRGPDDIKIKVMTSDGCAWTTTNTASWVTVADGTSGSGNGTVHLLIAPNSGSDRSTTLTIAGQPFTLSQLGGDGGDDQVRRP
jgi:hypothetical protein